MTSDRYEENETKAEVALKEFDLPPDPLDIPRLRKLLEEEASNQERAGNAYLRALCLLLWSHGDPQDAPIIAAAKFSDFDAGCMIDEEFLVCGDLEGTRTVLAASSSPPARKALDRISNWSEPFDQEEKVSVERRFYNLDP